MYDLQTSYDCEDQSIHKPKMDSHGQSDNFFGKDDFFQFDVDLLGNIPHMATVILAAKDQTLASAEIELRELASKTGQDYLLRLRDGEKQILTMIKLSVNFSMNQMSSRISTARNSFIDVSNSTERK